MRLIRYAVIAVVGMLLLGCGAKERGEDAQKTALSAATGFAEQPIEVIQATAIKDLLGQRNGKVLFLNLWATWCEPCKEEFPDIVSLANEMSGAEVEFVSISFDYPDEVESKIRPFLRENKVTFRSLVADADDPETFINAINPEWNGALPVTAIYSSNGKRLSFLVGKRAKEEFKRELARARQSS